MVAHVDEHDEVVDGAGGAAVGDVVCLLVLGLRRRLRYLEGAVTAKEARLAHEGAQVGVEPLPQHAEQVGVEAAVTASHAVVTVEAVHDDQKGDGGVLERLHHHAHEDEAEQLGDEAEHLREEEHGGVEEEKRDEGRQRVLEADADAPTRPEEAATGRATRVARWAVGRRGGEHVPHDAHRQVDGGQAVCEAEEEVEGEE